MLIDIDKEIARAEALRERCAARIALLKELRAEAVSGVVAASDRGQEPAMTDRQSSSALSVRELVLKALASIGEGTSAEVLAAVLQIEPAVQAAAVYSEIYRGRKRGEIVREGGRHRLATDWH